MTRRAWVVALFELRATLRRRSYQVMTLLVPLVGLAAVGAVRVAIALTSGEEGGAARQGYVDLWGRLPQRPPAELSLAAYPSEEAARAAFISEEITAYFVVPADYLETGRVLHYVSGGAGLFPRTEALEALLRRALVADAVSPQVLTRVQAPVRLETVALTAAGEPGPERDTFSAFLVPYLFSLLLTFSIFATSGFLLQSVTEEKQSRTIEVVLSSVPAWVLLAGKVVGLGAAGLLQVGLWFASVRVLAALAGGLLPFPPITLETTTLALGLAFFLLGYLFFATVMAGVGAMATSVQEGNQIAGLVTMTAVVPLLLMTAILESPGGALARVLTYIPTTAPITVMLRLSGAAPPWPDLVGAAAVLLLATATALALSSRLFRTFLLLYGRRPGLREVWRTLRTG